LKNLTVEESMANSNHKHVLRLSYGQDSLQFGELHLPANTGSHPVVILIHGGFWHRPYDYTLMTGLADDLAQRGIAAWNIEYRRIGDAGGGWPGTMLDVAQATDFVRSLAPSHNLDLNRVVPIGHSAGGHLALWLAARHNIPENSELTPAKNNPLSLLGIISLAGVSDLQMSTRMNLGNGAGAELLGGSPEQVPERYRAASPAALLPLHVRQVLVHGTADDRVPYEMSDVYMKDAQAAGDNISLITLDGVDHFALIDPASEAWAKTIEALKRLIELE
jgi:acetyl esterase/lipase